MSTPRIAPYGFWKSPITSDRIATEAMRLGQVALDGDAVYWSELRPAEKGHSVVVCCAPDGAISDRTPPGVSARTRVHEYGGGAFTVHNGTIYFATDADQHLYRQEIGCPPVPITAQTGMRYADGVIDARRGRMLCVREDHTDPERPPVNTLVSVDLSGREPPQVLVSGMDFYSSLRLSPDGSRLAWLAWRHPNMPWDGTELWVAAVDAGGALGPAERVAGGDEESIFQPEWSPAGELYFVSDRTGWWNLYHLRDGAIEALCPMEAEFGQPQWVFGLSTYAFVSADLLVCAYTQHGTWRLAKLDLRTRRGEACLAPTPIDLPYTEIAAVRATPDHVLFLGGSPSEPLSLVRLDLATCRREVLRRSSEPDHALAAYVSAPQAVEFPTENGLTAHGLFYPPRNPDYAPPAGEQPPLLVHCHGGPTSSASSTLSLSIQYWTSRGIAVLDVNYGGSSGYGRAYRERLRGQWGVVDVDDCVNGARYLVAQGRVDGQRLAICGGSAGGYTALCALTFRDVFHAGASHFGVSDLEALARDTHKFEARYLDTLVGPYPECRALYEQRSPIHAAGSLSVPIIFFQGAEDAVVPPSQTERMVEALRAKGVPVGYFLFEGEQHGFRRAENIQRALDGELYFYAVHLMRSGLRF
jgi:dipeptidyl aminopeptidase/acylaminoacyl peptidase